VARDPKTGRFPPRPEGGPAKGEGYGGPAKGAHPAIPSNLQPAAPFEPGNPGWNGTLSERKKRLQDRAYTILEKALEKAEQRSDVTMIDLGVVRESLERTEGKAIQPNVNYSAEEYANASLDDIRAERERLDAALAEARASGNAPVVPDKPAGVVH
jgi:hypothetical protein